MNLPSRFSRNKLRRNDLKWNGAKKETCKSVSLSIVRHKTSKVSANRKDTKNVTYSMRGGKYIYIYIYLFTYIYNFII